MASQKGALAGIHVLDLTRVLAGPWCAMLLGDLGADVIKVESPGAGDESRGWGPPFVGGQSAYYLGCNRNKRGIAVDFSHPDGRALLQRLVAKADVVIDNFKPGTMARWGFTSQWFDEHAQHVVRCSITGYGEDGPRSHLPGYDFVLQAESGLMSICGPAKGEPTKYGVAVIDMATGMLAANAVQAALIARFRTGRGQKVEACLYDTAIAMLVNVGTSHLATGDNAQRYGNGHPSIVPYTTFHTLSGAIAIAVGNDGQFQKIAEILGHAEWVKDERFATNAARVQNRAIVEEWVGNATSEWEGERLIAALRGVGIPCGRVHTVTEALADTHTLARRMVVGFHHPTAGAVRTLGTPIRFSDTPTVVERAPPLLGQHTREVLQWELGLSTDEINALAEAKVIACAVASNSEVAA